MPGQRRLSARDSSDNATSVIDIPIENIARVEGVEAKEGEPREVVFYPKLVEACDDTLSALDTNGNGEIDLLDLDTDGDGIPDQHLNGDGTVDEADLALYLDMSCTYRDYSPTAVRPGMGCLLQDRRRHGCRRRAYKDVFTACLEEDIPSPGE